MLETKEDKDGCTFEIDLSKQSEDRYLLDHVVEGLPILPAAAHFIFVWKALASRKGKTWDQTPVHFEDVKVHRAVMLSADSKFKENKATCRSVISYIFIIHFICHIRIPLNVFFIILRPNA